MSNKSQDDLHGSINSNPRHYLAAGRGLRVVWSSGRLVIPCWLHTHAECVRTRLCFCSNRQSDPSGPHRTADSASPDLRYRGFLSHRSEWTCKPSCPVPPGTRPQEMTDFSPTGCWRIGGWVNSLPSNRRQGSRVFYFWQHFKPALSQPAGWMAETCPISKC